MKMVKVRKHSRKVGSKKVTVSSHNREVPDSKKPGFNKGDMANMQSRKVEKRSSLKDMAKEKEIANPDLSKYKTKQDAIYDLNVKEGGDYDEVVDYVNEYW